MTDNDMGLELFGVVCRRCGSEATIGWGESGGCSDPECCSTYAIVEVSCPSCGAEEKEYS